MVQEKKKQDRMSKLMKEDKERMPFNPKISQYGLKAPPSPSDGRRK